jgi:hypothetical protein
MLLTEIGRQVLRDFDVELLSFSDSFGIRSANDGIPTVARHPIDSEEGMLEVLHCWRGGFDPCDIERCLRRNGCGRGKSHLLKQGELGLENMLALATSGKVVAVGG